MYMPDCGLKIFSFKVISAEQLLEYLADLLMSLTPDSGNSLPDFQHNMNDAISILPKLQTGLLILIKLVNLLKTNA